MPAHAPWITAVTSRISPQSSSIGTLRHWVLGLCNGGSVEHGPPHGPRFILGPGEVLVIRPGVAQRWVVAEGCEWDVASCIFVPRPHWLPWLELDPVAPGFMRLRLKGKDWDEARRCFARACAASGSAHDDALDIVAHAIEAALLLCRRVRASAASRVDERVRLALAALTADLTRPMSLAELARHSGISTPHLTRLFRRQVGSSPAAYLAKVRLQRASHLLRHSDLPIKAIARAVGFPDQRYFSSWFGRMHGQTPSRYRHPGP